MSDYSYGDIMRMQDEAKRRVMEMQKRSRYVAQNFNEGNKINVKSEPEKTDVYPEEELPRVPKAISYPTELRNYVSGNASSNNKNLRKGQGIDIRNSLLSVFSDMTSDECEKMFILSLCLLLSKEKADESLIMALMYLAT